MQHAVKQSDVGPGLYRKMQIRGSGGRRGARIDDDGSDRGISRFGRFDAAIKNRMRPRGVRSGDEETTRIVDVVVAGRWRIGAERRFVAGNGARHAKTRIGVDVVRANEPFGELVENVI